MSGLLAAATLLGGTAVDSAAPASSVPPAGVALAGVQRSGGTLVGHVRISAETAAVPPLARASRSARRRPVRRVVRPPVHHSRVIRPVAKRQVVKRRVVKHRVLKHRVLKHRVVTRTVTRHPAGPSSSVALHALVFAATQRGKPYRWGATGPSSFDCSGLVQWAYARAGVRIPRTTYSQYAALQHVPRSGLRLGDLVFSHSLGHVGIYAGYGLWWEAPHTGARVRLVRIWDPRFLVARVR